MSQASHRIYKELVPLEKKYNYYRRCLENGDTCGVCDGTFPNTVLRYKYDFLKKKLEYDTQCVQDEEYERLYNWWSKEERDKAEEKIEKNPELIKLKRIVFILKIKLINIGYNKRYL